LLIELPNRLLQTKCFVGAPTDNLVVEFADLFVVLAAATINAVNRIGAGFEQAALNECRKKALAEGENGLSVQETFEPEIALRFVLVAQFGDWGMRI
jgi:hypothetical protein